MPDAHKTSLQTDRLLPIGRPYNMLMACLAAIRECIACPIFAGRSSMSTSIMSTNSRPDTPVSVLFQTLDFHLVRIAIRPPTFHLRFDKLRMLVYTGHQAQRDRSSNCFCNFSLIYRSQARAVGMSNPSHLGHVFGHDREVLV